MVSFHVVGLQECHFQWWKEKKKTHTKKKSRQVHRGFHQRTGCPQWQSQNGDRQTSPSLFKSKGVGGRLHARTIDRPTNASLLILQPIHTGLLSLQISHSTAHLHIQVLEPTNWEAMVWLLRSKTTLTRKHRSLRQWKTLPVNKFSYKTSRLICYIQISHHSKSKRPWLWHSKAMSWIPHMISDYMYCLIVTYGPIRLLYEI